MNKNKKLLTMEVYELLERQMIILATIFAVVAAVCGFMAFKYGKSKSEAEELAKKEAAKHMKWTDENKNVAAFRFTCYNKTEDLKFLYGTLHITKKSEGKSVDEGSINVIAKESEIYLSEGTYTLVLSTRQYKDASIEVSIRNSNIGERMWYTFSLEKKDV